MALSGDYRIDALLRGAAYRWNADFALGTATVVPYAFAQTLPSYYASAPSYVTPVGGLFEPLDEAHRTHVRNELAAMSSAVPGLRFFESADVDAAAIVVSAYAPPDDTGSTQGDATGYAPGGADTAGANSRLSGDVWFRTTSFKYDLAFTVPGLAVQPTVFADMALHELGHAVGLKHPGNYSGDGSGSNGPPYLPAAEDSSVNTVMSYYGDYAGAEPRPYDLLALRFLYGSVAPSSGRWLLASDGGTVVQASSLDELIVAHAPAETVDGGGGCDVVRYAGSRAAYAVGPSAGGFAVTDRASGSVDRLTRVERLEFADANVALDLAAGQSAAQTVQMIGAAFGPDTVANRAYVGVGLRVFDAGYALVEVAQLCIDTGLVSLPDHRAFVAAVWHNVVGTPIDEGNLAYFTGLLESGTYTQAGLLAMAAETEANRQHVDLVGLATAGVEYI